MPKSVRTVGCGPRQSYPSLYHLDGFPPVCLPHEVEASTGVDDELVPYSQGVQLAGELARRNHPTKDVWRFTYLTAQVLARGMSSVKEVTYEDR